MEPPIFVRFRCGVGAENACRPGLDADRGRRGRESLPTRSAAQRHEFLEVRSVI